MNGDQIITLEAIWELLLDLRLIKETNRITRVSPYPNAPSHAFLPTVNAVIMTLFFLPTSLMSQAAASRPSRPFLYSQ